VRIGTEVISDVVLRPLQTSRKEVAALVDKATAALQKKWDSTLSVEAQINPSLLSVVTEQPEFEKVTHLLESAVEDKEDTTRDVGDIIGPELMEFFSQGRFINGTKAMVIDLDRCTRCDDCVRACASTHDNNPRFLRHGPFTGKFMVANACMHCADPVCMLDCPTGAIHRIPQGEVFIDHRTCVGCKACYLNCPYEAIRMVEVRDQNGDIRADEKTHAPILKATKCDLCVEQFGGPACQRACPHGALARVDLTDLGSFVQWFGK
jgi:Fe-S-cluster-containing dehydrogenase component